MLRYLSLDIICSSKLTVVRFPGQIKSADTIFEHMSVLNGGYFLYSHGASSQKEETIEEFVQKCYFI